MSQKYNELRKQSYYFESDLINELSSISNTFKEELVDNGYTQTEAINICDNFVKQKEEKKEEIRTKEIAYFDSNVQIYLEMAQKLNKEMAIKFLSKMNITYDGEYFYHGKSSNIKTQANVIGLTKFTVDQKTFSKQERDFLKKINNNEWNQFQFQEMQMNYYLFKYIPDEKVNQARLKMNADYTNKVLQVTEGEIKEQVERFARKGNGDSSCKRKWKLGLLYRSLSITSAELRETK